MTQSENIHTRFRFVHSEDPRPTIDRPTLIEVIALDGDTAWRMVNNYTNGWDQSRLVCCIVQRSVPGPSHFIRIDPSCAPMLA